MMMMIMKRKAVSLSLAVILLISLFGGPVAAESARPPFVGKGIQETKLTVPSEFHEYDSVRLMPIVSNSQALPFILLRGWNHGTRDGMVDLWFVQNEEFTFLETIRGDATPYPRSNIAYKDDGSVAFFHVGRGGLWMIDASTKEIQMVTNGLGEQSYFAVLNGSLYFMVQSRKELWTSDWTKEGTELVQAFEYNNKLVRSVTDGFVMQAYNNSLYYWDASDRSNNYLPGIEIQDCAPNDVASIQGDNGSKGLISANGLWSIGRHPPKSLADDYSWLSYVGNIKNEVLLNMYSKGSSFKVTDGEGVRPMSVPLDGTSQQLGSQARIFGPFTNNAHSIFMGRSFSTLDDKDADKAEIVATLADPNPLTGFIPLLEDNKVLIRSVAKLWEFDAARNEIRLLVDWDESVYIEPTNSWGRDRTWDIFFALDDGSLLMPMRKTAGGGTPSPLEFWSIQMNANTDEHDARVVDPVPAPTTSPDDGSDPTTDDGSNPNSTTPTLKPTTDENPKVDDSSSSMVPLVVPRLGTAFLLVLLGIWM